MNGLIGYRCRWICGVVLVVAAACGPSRDLSDSGSSDDEPSEPGCLPADFEECAADNGSMEFFGEQTCWFQVTEEDACFEDCEEAGGGISISDPDDLRSCEVVYGEMSGPCYGNACD